VKQTSIALKNINILLVFWLLHECVDYLLDTLLLVLNFNVVILCAFYDYSVSVSVSELEVLFELLQEQQWSCESVIDNGLIRKVDNACNHCLFSSIIYLIFLPF
jgi:hypothetical protein